MTIPIAPSEPQLSVWHLFSPARVPATLMLGGGVTLYAVETYITATVTPSIVRDIGGLPLLSWVTTLYVAAAVLGSIFVAMRPRGTGLRAVYVIGALIFGAGSLICAAAPGMILLLAGRAVQGLGAGILAGLAYAFIRFAYPEVLWRKASTLYAGIWGIATLLGPTLGGVFSEGSAWRYAFVVLVPLSGLMAGAAPFLLPPAEDDRADGKTPFWQILLLLVAVLLVSFAGTIDVTSLKATLVVFAIAGVAIMLFIERRSAGGLLPNGSVNLRKPIARVYLTMFTLLLVLTSDIYIPYFLQTLHGMTPLVSGYLTALVALGWTLAAFFTGTLSGRTAGFAIVAGCTVEAVSCILLAIFLARENGSGDLMLLGPPVVAIFLIGAGVGLAWAHLVAKVLHIVGDAEQDKASAAISSVQSLGSAFGASISGVIVNSTGLVDPGGPVGDVSAGQWLYIAMAVSGIITVTVALTLSRDEV